MLFSHLFGRTLYEAPADAEIISHRLALRAGLVQPVSAGMYAYLPVGWRALRRVESIWREEMEALDAQEIRLPAVRPVETDSAAAARLTDNAWQPADPAALLASIGAHELLSYRQLPAIVCQVQTRLEGDARPRRGLLGLRQRLAAEVYSFDADPAGLDGAYGRLAGALRRVLARCEVAAREVEAEDGVAFVVPHPQGDDTVMRCDGCGYAATALHAAFDKQAGSTGEAEPQPLAEVATPDCETIAQLAEFLNIPASQTLKGVFYEANGRLVVVAIRGDLEVNEAKLARWTGELAPAPIEMIRAAGIEPGYGSAVGRPVARTLDGDGLIVVADDSVPAARNLVAGANRPGYHLTGANFGRDFAATLVADIALARAGSPCARCGTPLAAEPAVELGRCTRLGTRIAERLDARFKDASGAPQPFVMGRYALDLDRLLAAVLERHHDERGIVWPRSIAPYDVHLLTLGADPEIRAAGEAAYDRLRATGLGVLYDDREESAGVKFADADLIGLPVRMTIGRRSLKAGGAEVKARAEEQARVVALDALVEAARAGQ